MQHQSVLVMLVSVAVWSQARVCEADATDACVTADRSCNGHGHCTWTLHNRFQCTCNAGWMGDFCEQAVQTTIVCEHEDLHLDCNGGTIKIYSVKYGRRDTTTCPNRRMHNTDCDNPEVNHRVFTAVRDRCDGEPTCTKKMDNKVGGDPCRGTSKYSEVQYSCQPDKFNRKVEALEHKVEQLIAKLDEANEANGANMEQQNAEINSLKQTVKEVNLEMTRVRDCLTPAVGFMAVISGSGRPATIAANTDVVFDKILTDSSSSYDTSTGRFHCEIAGLYQFSVSVATHPTDQQTDKSERKYAKFSLMVNGRVTTTAIADSSDVWDAASVSATVMLNKGDTVFVKSKDNRADPSQYKDWQPNTFSGHLVVKAGCEM